MVSPFLVFRSTVFGLFIILNTILCSVAAWNLGFTDDSPRGSRQVSVDAFIIFNGSLGLLTIFPIIFTELTRRGALTSRVWFELTWLTFFWLLNLAAAVAVSCIALNDMCQASSHGSEGACSSAKALVAFSWLNTVFLFLYLAVLLIFSILHQREDKGVWHSSTIDVPWFATKQCIRSAPSSPHESLSRFARTKPPSIVAPKPRRAGPPPPLFIHGRAGLGSQVEIEHFTDAGTVEAQTVSPSIPQPVLRMMQTTYCSNPDPFAFYPQQVQNVHQSQNPSLGTTVWNASYFPSQAREKGSSPPPLGDWPRRSDSTSRRKRERAAAQLQYQQPQAQLSERAIGKQRSLVPPSRTGSDASTKSDSSRRGPPLEPLETNRSNVKLPAANVSPTSSQDSPSRSRPGGPRTRACPSGFVRPRPPPLDLTRRGATPNSRR